MVREYAVDNLHKVISSWDKVIFVRETEESAHVQSPKQVIILIFIFL